MAASTDTGASSSQTMDAQSLPVPVTISGALEFFFGFVPRRKRRFLPSRAHRYAKSDAAAPSGEHRSYREMEAVVDGRCHCIEQGSDQFADVLLGCAAAMLICAKGRGSQKSETSRNA